MDCEWGAGMHKQLILAASFLVSWDIHEPASAVCPLQAALNICLNPELSSTTAQQVVKQNGYTIIDQNGLYRTAVPKAGSVIIATADGQEFGVFFSEFSDLQLMDCSLTVSAGLGSSACSADDIKKFDTDLRARPKTSVDVVEGEGRNRAYFVRSSGFWARAGVLLPTVGPINVLVTRAKTP